ncbi:MAG: ATP-dependent sacrificial sulfur transferase LarE [Clostridia bacterium]|nr:ATP-dependent sacrificial sulfur transferase LarE [Clostridia bacterium]
MDHIAFFQQHDEVAVAFSGGVDSSVLLALAKRYAKRVKAYYVKTQFQPQFELDDALEVAKLLDVEIRIIQLDVTADPVIAGNPENRCYFCKKKIFSAIIRCAKADGFEAVLDGTNASDDIADRPGFAALSELGVLSPLRMCNLSKHRIRQIAKENDLPVASKPSYACLATRIPYGVRITDEILKKTEVAEDLLRKAGYSNFRVRYLNGSAKLELGKVELELFRRREEETIELLSPFYEAVFLDPKERADE